MGLVRLCIVIVLLSTSFVSEAQTDSTIQSLQQLPTKYIKQVDAKVDKYTTRITNKTEKTLTKLAKWENKIHTLLQKANPEAAQRLFGNNQLTFASALEKYKKGEAIVAAQKARYDEYRDKLTTSIKYLETKKDSLNAKLVQPLKDTKEKLSKLEVEQSQTEAMEQFIKERKKQLINQSVQYIGNSKYLAKISKESYYYVETLRNYKAIFSDKKKAEETALTILSKIKAFTKFTQQNSMLASLFGSPSNGGTAPNLAGLQTRASINALIQNQIAAGGPSAAAQIRQNITDAQAQLSQLKDKILKAGGNSSDAEIPDFKVNPEKSRTFFQRIKLGTDLNFAKTNSVMPSVANVALTASYKLSSNKEFGIGIAYRAGLGSINHIQFSHQGIGFRSFGDLKFKKNFWITGGWETNYNAGFKNIEQLKTYDVWQESLLAGLSKRMDIKTKWFKGSKISILYDALAQKQVPRANEWVFRVGYGF